MQRCEWLVGRPDHPKRGHQKIHDSRTHKLFSVCRIHVNSNQSPPRRRESSQSVTNRTTCLKAKSKWAPPTRFSPRRSSLRLAASSSSVCCTLASDIKPAAPLPTSRPTQKKKKKVISRFKMLTSCQLQTAGATRMSRFATSP